MTGAAEIRTLSMMLAVLVGLIIGAYVTERIYLPQISIYNSERDSYRKSVARLQGERQELQTVIVALKRREDRIVQETLEGLGIPPSHRQKGGDKAW